MSSISFRDRAYRRPIDSSFFARSGDTYCDTSRYAIGDEVTIMFEITEQQFRAIHAAEIDGVYGSSNGSTNEKWHIYIPCIVVKRKHFLVHQHVGQLQEMSGSVVLEAETGHWEDVLKWVLSGTQPSWIEEPETVGKS